MEQEGREEKEEDKEKERDEKEEIILTRNETPELNLCKFTSINPHNPLVPYESSDSEGLSSRYSPGRTVVYIVREGSYKRKLMEWKKGHRENEGGGW